MSNYLRKLQISNQVAGIIVLLLSLGLILYRGITVSYFTKKPTFFVKIFYPESKSAEAEINSIDISNVPFIELKRLATNDYNNPQFQQNGTTYKILYQGKAITHLQISPDKKNVGFYDHRENTIFSNISLIIMDIKEKKTKKIYEGSSKTSNWEWKDNGNVIVYFNCGSSCHYAYVYSIQNGNLIAEYLDK